MSAPPDDGPLAKDYLSLAIAAKFPSAIALAEYCGAEIESKQHRGNNGERERKITGGWGGLHASEESTAWCVLADKVGSSSLIRLANLLRNGVNEDPSGAAWIALAEFLVPDACRSRNEAFEAKRGGLPPPPAKGSANGGGGPDHPAPKAKKAPDDPAKNWIWKTTEAALAAFAALPKAADTEAALAMFGKDYGLRPEHVPGDWRVFAHSQFGPGIVYSGRGVGGAPVFSYRSIRRNEKGKREQRAIHGGEGVFLLAGPEDAPLVIVGGAEKAAAARAAGYSALCFMSGESALSPEWAAKLAKKNPAGGFIFAHDADEQGTKANAGSARAAAAAGIDPAKIRTIAWPEGAAPGLDLNDVLKAEGAEAVAALLEAAHQFATPRPELDPRWDEYEAGLQADATPPRVEAGEAPWPDVELDPAEPEPMAFPVDALPGRIQHWAMANAASLQTPVDFFALGALAMASTSVLQKVVCDANPYLPGDHTEYPALYILIASPSGTNKSRAEGVVSAPLNAFDRKAQYDYKQAVINARPDLDAIKADMDKIKRAVVKGTAMPNAADRLRELQEDFDRKTPAKPPAMKITDPTPEALSMKMKEQDERAGLVDTEGQFLSIITGLYSGKVNLDLMKRSYCADTYHCIRVGRPEIRLENPLLSILSFTQPDVIKRLGDKPQLKDEGFLGRCLIALPKTTVGFRDSSPRLARDRATPGDISAAYHETITALLNIPIPRDQFDWPEPRRIQLSFPAAELAAEFRAEIEPGLRPADGELSHVGEFASKIHGLSIRLALMLHLLDRADGSAGLDWRAVIEPETMAAGILVARYALAHHEIAFAAMHIKGEDHPGNPDSIQGKIWAAIRALDPDGDGARWNEVEQKTRRVKGMDRPAREAALAAMVRGGFVRIEVVKGKGRPARRILSNPKILRIE